MKIEVIEEVDVEFTIGRTRAFAIRQHGSQTDKNGKPYRVHLDAVARNALDLFGLDETTIKVAYLHDVVEDTPVTVQQIEDLFGEDVALAVDAISKRHGEPNYEYIGFVLENEIAARVKLADLYHNTHPGRLGQLVESTQARLRKKYFPAIYRLETYLGVEPTITRDQAVAAIKGEDSLPTAWTQMSARGLRPGDRITLAEGGDVHLVTEKSDFTEKGGLVKKVRIKTSKNQTFNLLADFKVRCKMGGQTVTQVMIDKYLGEWVEPPKTTPTLKTPKKSKPTAASLAAAGIDPNQK